VLIAFELGEDKDIEIGIWDRGESSVKGEGRKCSLVRECVALKHWASPSPGSTRAASLSSTEVEVGASAVRQQGGTIRRCSELLKLSHVPCAVLCLVL
jgi:hypothetical protein